MNRPQPGMDPASGAEQASPDTSYSAAVLLLGRVAHELRGPLSLASGHAELIKQDAEANDIDAVQSHVSYVLDACERLARLVDDLVDFSRLERGEVALERQPLDLADLVTGAIDALRPLPGGDRLQLRVAGSAPVLGDPVRLSQVLTNLVHNAMRYAPAGPIVVEVASVEKRWAQIRVRDRGPGIEVSDQPLIWREFYRAPSAASARVQGSGVGLAVVKRLVEAHGGTVGLTSTPGQGATFEVRIPLHRAERTEVQAA